MARKGSWRMKLQKGNMKITSNTKTKCRLVTTKNPTMAIYCPVNFLVNVSETLDVWTGVRVIIQQWVIIKDGRGELRSIFQTDWNSWSMLFPHTDGIMTIIWQTTLKQTINSNWPGIQCCCSWDFNNAALCCVFRNPPVQHLYWHKQGSSPITLY